MINYIIQMLLFQTLFLAVYDLFLQKETFFKWNRIYLLATPILSFIIPLLSIESLQKTVPKEYIEYLPEVVINPQVYIENSSPFETLLGISTLIFYAGMGLFFILFLVRLTKILKLIFISKNIKKDNYTLIVIDEKQSAFSFFNYIFINKHLLENNDLQIIQHELIHCKHRHTLDLFFFELLKIVLWFNPLVYVYQKRITLLHEYISDAEVVKETDKITYFNKLLAETFNVENISFINQFFKHSLIKKRIIMITKEKSQKMKQLKYLLIAPLLLGMLFYSSCTDKLNDELFEMETVLSKSNDYSQGKYFDFEVGKTYVGNSILISRYLDTNEYTSKEKELHNKFNNLDGSSFDYIVIMDENNERVNWLRPKSKIESNKGSWEYVAGESVPFALIENVPVFPGCEGTEEELRQCLQEKITKHINSNFNVKMANNLGLQLGLKKIFVMFKIDNEGNISDVQSRAPHKKLEEEAIRVILSLPKMTPGKYKGKTVDVKYSLPIAFMVEGEKTDGIDDNNMEKVNPLYILDGKEISKMELNKIDTGIIKSMNVIKGEEAIKKYGDKGKNGVIEITINQ